VVVGYDVEFLCLTGLIAGLAGISRYPYWPSLAVLIQAVLRSRLPLRARKEQLQFIFLQISLSPFRGLAALIDEICFYSYKKVRVEPIFIIGEPRCGSTFLHRTMAMSGHHLAIRHFEWRYPFVVVLKLFQLARFESIFAGTSYWPKSAGGSEAAKMHPNRLSDWEEDGIFFEEGFCHHFFIFLRFPYRNVLAKTTRFSCLPEYAKKMFIGEHRRSIQKIAHSHGLKEVSYLSKEVVSHEMVPHLIAEYPQARFIISVRKSEEFVSSLMALARASTMAKNAGYDPVQDPEWQSLIIQRISNDCKLLVALCEQEIARAQQFRITADDLFDDVEGTINSIYDWLAMETSDDYAWHLSRIASKQKTRERGYKYDVKQFSGFDMYDNFVNEIERTKQFSNLPTPH